MKFGHKELEVVRYCRCYINSHFTHSSRVLLVKEKRMCNVHPKQNTTSDLWTRFVEIRVPHTWLGRLCPVAVHSSHLPVCR